MDAALLGALSAVLGSIVGGSASIATAWFTQSTQGRREAIRLEVGKRETLYADFIAECSRLVVDSLDHTLDRPGGMVNVYALHNRIKLIASDAVVDAAGLVIRHILERYFEPNVTKEELRQVALSMKEHDPLKPFSEACRAELARLQNLA